MAEIRKMSIQGIRAFSPFEPKTIKFLKPLTIIVGDNGCGKTTIIECLKIGCTGSLPPTVSNGQSFISDPSLSHQEEVKGQIKMEFVSQDGKVVHAIRSYSLRLVRGKLTFKTLDQTLSIVGANGHSSSISNRGKDIDLLIPQMLGMSRAIIENVVLCHQDEANWPLDDSRELKKRFDSIFESTHYTKALDSIRKEKKEKKEALVQLEKEEVDKQNKYNQALRIRNEITQLESQMEAQQTALASLTTQLENETSHKQYVDSELSRYDTIEQQIQVCSRDVEQQRKRVETTRGNLTEVLTLSEEAMQSELQIIQSTHQKTEEEQRRYTEAKQQAQLEVQQTTATIEEKNRQLIASQTILQENCKRMQSLLNEVNHPSLQAACQQLEAGAVNQTLMDSIRDVLQAEMTRVEKEYAEQEQRIRTLRAERDTSMKAKQALEVESELVKKTISLEINKMEMAIRELTQQIEAGERYCTQRLPGGIEQAEQTLQNNQQEIAKEKEELQVLSSAAGIGENGLQKELQQKIIEARKTLQILQDEYNAHQMLSSGKSDAVNEYLETKYQSLQQQLIQGMQQQGLDCEPSSQGTDSLLETTIASLQKDQSRLESERLDLLAKVSRDEGSHTTLTNLKTTKQSSVEELEVTIKPEFLSAGVEYSQSLDAFYAFIQSVSSQRNLTSIHTFTVISQHYHLLQLIDELSELEPQLLLLANNIRSGKKSLKAKEMVLDITQKKLDELLTLQKQFLLFKDIEKDRQQIASQHTEENESMRSLKERLVATKEEIERMEQDLQKQMETQTQQMETRNTRLFSLQSSILKKEQECMSLQTAMKDVQEKMRIVQQDRTKKVQFEKELSEKKAQQAENAKKEESNEVKQLREVIQMKDVAITNETEKSYQILQTKNKRASQFDQMMKLPLLATQSMIQETTSSLSTLKDLLVTRESELKETTLRLTHLHDQTASVHLRISVLKSNLQVHQEQRQLQQLEQQLAEYRSQLVAIDIHTIRAAQATREATILRLSKEINQKEGVLSQLQKQRDHANIELHSRDYENIDARYNEVKVKVLLVNLMLEDFDKYLHSIEESLLVYHQTKIREINERIADLWQETYQGKDIENIEIESKSIVRGSKKVFEYAVYMVKNNTRLQMRSRCSAGQKALASLVIRMALAEAFCSHCGVLALDEPTTNLDRENKVALVYSLKQIISHRKKQQNFQLIVITHDEEFGQLLTQAELGDRMSYYRISRQESEHVRGMFVSTINRQSWM